MRFFKAMDKEVKIEYFEMPDNIKNQYQNFTESDNTKISTHLKKEYMSLEESVEDYIKNHLSNNWQYL